MVQFRIPICLCLVLLTASVAPKCAGSIWAFSGSADHRAAEVVFDNSTALTLKVTLTNTSSSDVLVPVDVLTAVFFDIPGFSLTPVSALLNGGSTVLFGPTNGGNMGGEWAYEEGLSGAPGSANRGISSSGYGLFGDSNFNGPSLHDPDAVDGLQYGITSLGDDPATGNTPVTGGNMANPVGLIKNSVVFTLTYGSGSLDLSKISKVSFQYGTGLNEPNVPGEPNGPPPPPPGGDPPFVPEPTSVAVWSLIVGLGVFVTSRSKR
jgi:hypothetical protein